MDSSEMQEPTENANPRAHTSQDRDAVDTGDGASIGHSVNITRGDFVGRDKIGYTADEVAKLIEKIQRTELPTPPLIQRAEVELISLFAVPETVLIPAGKFIMGFPDRDPRRKPEWKAHSVDLPAYRIGKYPVTNEQYAAFVDQHPEQHPQGVGWRFKSPPPDQPHHPVTGISWYDAVAYCEWLSALLGQRWRLPSEAEWEKAARGDQDDRTYPWGEELMPERCNVNGLHLMSVDAYPAGASPFGCQNMIGNAGEWTNTIWGDQPGYPQFIYPYRSDQREILKPKGNALRIYRGSAYDDGKEQLGCSVRNFYSPDAHLKNLGFRVLLELS